MANDRIWIVHRESGERRLFAKYYPSGSCLWCPLNLETWVEDCLNEECGADLGGTSPFYFEVESATPPWWNDNDWFAGAD